MGGRGDAFYFVAMTATERRVVHWFIDQNILRWSDLEDEEFEPLPLTAKALANIADRPAHRGEPDCNITDDSIYSQLQSTGERSAADDFAFYRDNPDWDPNEPPNRRVKPPSKRVIKKAITREDRLRGRWGPLGPIDTRHPPVVDYGVSTETIHMTQKDFATAVGCHPTAVGRWVDGSRTPGIDFIDDVARVLGITHEEAMQIREQGRWAEVLQAWLETGVVP